MPAQDELLDKRANIVIATEFKFQGKVLEITPTHHIIETSNGIQEVLNEKVIQVRPFPVKIKESNID